MTTSSGAPPLLESEWWRRAVIYQVYLRSFADGDGDGIGDIAGLRSRLPYLAGLGVDAVWVTPWYPSPMKDGGYDVADFRDVDPTFGTLAEAELLVRDAHALGLRVLVDIVPNHTSDQHPWFREAVASGRGSPARSRYLFRDGRGDGEEEPPNDWTASFGGPAWTRVVEPDGRPGQWYLHLFAPEQPDLDWTHPEVAADFERTLAFWFDRGLDGFRIDVAMGLAKDPSLPDLGHPGALPDGERWVVDHPYYDRDEVHAIWRGWRRIADVYDPPRVFVGEIALTSPARLARYLAPGELHTAFNFDFLKCAWDARALRATVDSTLAELSGVGAPATWVLGNHDEVRVLSRLGRKDTAWSYPLGFGPGEPDLASGERRARAAALLLLALPGGAYVYQGEELGLPQVMDLPDEVLQDPTWERSGRTDRGRDGCRVPFPWSGDRSPFGFGPPGSVPWLPQPEAWVTRTVGAQDADDRSTLRLYRTALALRRAEPGLAGDAFAWHPSPEGTLVFARGDGFVCAVNLSDRPLELPADRTRLLRSDGASGPLGPDAAEWYREAAA